MLFVIDIRQTYFVGVELFDDMIRHFIHFVSLQSLVLSILYPFLNLQFLPQLLVSLHFLHLLQFSQRLLNRLFECQCFFSFLLHHLFPLLIHFFYQLSCFFMTLYIKFSLGLITLYFLYDSFYMLIFYLVVDLLYLYHQLLSFFMELSLDMVAGYAGTVTDYSSYL